MIHAIIFANRGGFDFWGSTVNFPASFKDPIEQICSALVVGDTPCEPALRYTPLNGCYLLTVIFRLLNGNEEEHRKHTVAVNFLMDPSDADSFFDVPFTVAARHAIQTADTLRACRNNPLPAEVCSALIPSAPQSSQTPAGDVSLPLLTGVYHFIPGKQNAGVFIQSAQPAAEALEALIGFLPPPLRKQLSFHTDSRSPSESREIAICCTRGSACAPPAGSKSFFGFDSSHCAFFDSEEQIATERMKKLPDELPLYPYLKHSITTWDQYFKLCLLLKEPQKPLLKEALKILPDKDVLRAITKNPPSEEVLSQLMEAARPKSDVYKEASRRLHLPDSRMPNLLSVIFPLALMTLLTAFCLWMQLRTEEPLWALPCTVAGISTGYYLRGLINRLFRKK